MRDAVELCLDVRLLAGGADQRRVAARPEQQPDRVREDRLAGSRLAGDRVQAAVELDLGLLNEDEVRDPQRPEHAAMVGAGAALAAPADGAINQP